MSQNKQKITAVIGSIIGMAIFIGLFIVGIIFFSYLLIIGGIIGLVLFIIAYIRGKFFMKRFQAEIRKEEAKRKHGGEIHKGRTIDHD